MTRVRDSVCIVTGAASGIGRELVIQACQRGAGRVIGTDINGPGLAETDALVRSAGGKLESYVNDVGNAEQVNSFVDSVMPTLGGRRLILVNNAGIALCSGRFQDTTMEEFLRLLDINLIGAIRLTKGFYSYLLDHNEGHVVNVSSVFGLGGVDGQSAYCTSKFAIRGFTETLRMELHGSNVHVTCVHPGGIKTNIVRNSKPSGSVMTQEKYELLISDFDKIARTTADQAARQILNAIEKNRTRLVIGLDGKQFDWTTRILPIRYTALIIRQYRNKMVNPYDP